MHLQTTEQIFQQMKIPWTQEQGEEQGKQFPTTTMEVSSEQALGIYPCQVLYYWVFYSSAVGGSWPPCPAT